MSEQAVNIASKLYGMRSTAKFLLGTRYDAFVTGMALQIRDIMELSPRKGLTPLDVARELAGAPGISPHQVIMIMATAVDMTEGNV